MWRFYGFVHEIVGAIHEMWRFYGFVHEIVGAIHEMGRFYGFVCLIMLEGGVGLGVWE